MKIICITIYIYIYIYIRLYITEDRTLKYMQAHFCPHRRLIQWGTVHLVHNELTSTAYECKFYTYMYHCGYINFVMTCVWQCQTWCDLWDTLEHWATLDHPWTCEYSNTHFVYAYLLDFQLRPGMKWTVPTIFSWVMLIVLLV